MENPCAENEFLALGGWIRLDVTRRVQHGQLAAIRATLSPHMWSAAGWDEIDPDYDPAIPNLGDPDWVYAASGSSRDRTELDGQPTSGVLNGEFELSGSGPSDGLVVRYAVTYSVNEYGLTSAEITRIDFVCPDKTVVENLPFEHF